jgi:hypothetical protein
MKKQTKAPVVAPKTAEAPNKFGPMAKAAGKLFLASAMILPLGGMVATQTGCGDDNGNTNGPIENEHEYKLYLGDQLIIIDDQSKSITKEQALLLQGPLNVIAKDEFDADIVAGLKLRNNVRIIVEDVPAYESGHYRVVNANTIAIRKAFLLGANETQLRNAIASGFRGMLNAVKSRDFSNDLLSEYDDAQDAIYEIVVDDKVIGYTR